MENSHKEQDTLIGQVDLATLDPSTVSEAISNDLSLPFILEESESVGSLEDGEKEEKINIASVEEQVEEAGVFVVGESGEISLEYIYDGGSNKGQLIAFSLDEMEGFEGSFSEYSEAIVAQALDEEKAYFVSNDQDDKAVFEGDLNEQGLSNGGTLAGERVFTFEPGERIGLMLMPTGDLEGEAFFSFLSANPDGVAHSLQMQTTEGVLIGFEDLFNGGDGDFQDVLFNLQGIETSYTHLPKNIDEDRVWWAMTEDENYEYELFGEISAYTGIIEHTLGEEYGYTGEEVIWGTPEADELIATDKDSTIYALSGDDYVDGGVGDDVIYGEEGNDYLIGQEGNDLLFGGEGDDIIRGWPGEDELYGGNGNDELYAGEDDDKLYGENGDDHLDGRWGNDLLFGGEGNDKLYGGDELYGSEDGDDELYGGDGDDLLDGGVGDDKLYGEEGNDYLIGQEGNDLLFGGEGDDLLDGGKHNDSLYGWDGDDEMYGDEGDDTLMGEYGADVINGGKGNDNLFGGQDGDLYTGFNDTSGKDFLYDWSGDGSIDILDLSEFSLDDLSFSVTDHDQNGFLDSLKIDFNSESSVEIYWYFDDYHTCLENITDESIGYGEIEIINTADASLEFADVIALV